MLAYVLARHALAQAAAGGLIVLALGSLAARGCRQPVQRIRIAFSPFWGRWPCRVWACCP